MRMRVYKFLNTIYCYCVLFVSKIVDLGSDLMSYIKSFFSNLWTLWKLIWSGVEFSTIWQAIKLSFGAIIVSGRNAAQCVRQKSNERAFCRQQNVNFGTTNTWCELSLFSLANSHLANSANQ